MVFTKLTRFWFRVFSSLGFLFCFLIYVKPKLHVSLTILSINLSFGSIKLSMRRSFYQSQKETHCFEREKIGDLKSDCDFGFSGPMTTADLPDLLVPPVGDLGEKVEEVVEIQIETKLGIGSEG